jgi:malonyl CoA-acyl carrier protein transacylase
VFVLRGDDRADLGRRVRALEAWLTGHESVRTADLAATLAGEGQAAKGGSRLAVVAGSVSELRSRLVRAAERLDDPRVSQIKDTQGIYYFERPLHPQGRLALLFPGEGGQYLNMLADLLPHFPEVRSHFEHCSNLSGRTGRGRPILHSFFLAEGATAEERGRAEAELFRLDVAIAGMLIANWSLYQVLLKLGVRPDALGGHSSGEFSALAAAGCLVHDDFLSEQLFSLGDVLRREEDEGRMADGVLLAAGTSRRRAEEAIAQTGAAVQVAMDNCPHQTVLAGPASAMEAVEVVLRERGVVCERLPFGRPYHTPQFEPHLGPVARMFDALHVRPPRVPVYSCMTGRRFPPYPAEIRRLAVAHWSAPVEFVRMIEAMYADGVRLYIETGPRGTLTAFVEDILRGRPYAAIPANVPHRSGPTQLNHLAALLFAHHVPLRLEHLFARRASVGVGPAGRGGQEGAARLAAPTPTQSALLTRYMGVMGQFLDVQREVVSRYLARPRRQPAPLAPCPAAGARPMLGEVVRHAPGKSLLLRRRIDLDEDLYARDHTLGGRHASALDANHHGLPVMPMAFSMEMMAETAALLVPGLHVVRLESVRLHRWIPLDEEPVTLEVQAGILPDSPRRVAVAVRDLGNGRHLGPQETPSVEAVVVLAEDYPHPPAAGDFPLTGPGPCLYTPEQLYEGERRMFHGPLFQVVCATERQGEEGIEGRLRALPHQGLFRSFPKPDLLTDPLLIDASTHLLGCWHLARPDSSGRVVFPYEIGALDLYGPPPPARTEVRCRVRVERRTARQVRHRIELIAPDGRLWCRLAPADYWRFYWPQEYVDFFRFKENVLLAHPWPRLDEVPGGLPPHHVARSAEGTGGPLRLDVPDDLRQPVLRDSVARVALSPAEWREYCSLRMSEDGLTDWLYGRVAAKDAARADWFRRDGVRLFPADLEVQLGPGDHAVVRPRGPGGVETLRVSITHLAGAVLAAADLEVPRLPRERVTV